MVLEPVRATMSGSLLDCPLRQPPRIRHRRCADEGPVDMIYGSEGMQALFTRLATQIVYGGCDHDTADFYCRASGTTTADANPDPQKANFASGLCLPSMRWLHRKSATAPSSLALSNLPSPRRLSSPPDRHACTNARTGRAVSQPQRTRNRSCSNAALV